MKHVRDFNYFNKLKFYSVKWKSVHVLVIIVNIDNMHGEKLKIGTGCYFSTWPISAGPTLYFF